MMTRKRIVSLLAIFLIIAEAALFVLIQLTDGSVYEWLAFSSVGLALGFALTTMLLGTGGVLLRLGLFLTLAADYFLILAEPVNEEVGVAVFSLVQLTYFVALMLKQNSTKERVIHISARLALIALMLLVLIIVLGAKVDLLSILSAFYYANLLINIVFSFIRMPYGLLFSIGLMLLALCDLFLGLGYLGSAYLGSAEGSFLWWISHSSLNIPWLFYVPSCALISLSTVRNSCK